jgi:hypothetical protein
MIILRLTQQERWITVIPIILGVTLLISVALLLFNSTGKADTQPYTSYPIHKNITTTIFWVGEKANRHNGYIPNMDSAWDMRWVEHYGGVDTPNDRSGYYPASFIPKENPFYFALPYTDYGSSGRKRSAYNHIPWSHEKEAWHKNESMCKNRWIMITHESRIAYAQWEDAGPFQNNDVNYVFGTARPANKINNNAGLDVSPAVRDYLGLSDIDYVDWVFVEEEDVPNGPWKKIITNSNITWSK